MAASAAQSLPLAPPLFGLLVGERPLQTEWRVAGEGKLLIEIAHPASASEVSVFLLPGAVLPPDRGALIYFAPPPFTNWTNLGALSASKPSATLHTGWASHPELSIAPCIQLGLSIEPADAVLSAASALATAEWDKLGFAQLIARDLTEFVASYTTRTVEGNRLVLPCNAVDLWYGKFQEKWRHDPGFLLRKHG